MQNIEQLRAQYAIEQVEAITKTLNPKQQSEFKSYVTSLPAMVQINGLGQAIAFYRSKFAALDKPLEEDNKRKNEKGELAYKTVYSIIQGWLCDTSNPCCVYEGSDDLLRAITQHDMYQYRLAQCELQKLLSWLKKVTAAYIAEEKS